MHVDRLDHLVLTVADIDVSIDFYTRILGMRAVTFGEGRQALRFGRSKINLHQAGNEAETTAARPTPGSADLCLVSPDTPDQVVAELREAGVAVVEGPVAKPGALGEMISVYLRDPDDNLIEIAHYPE